MCRHIYMCLIIVCRKVLLGYHVYYCLLSLNLIAFSITIHYYLSQKKLNMFIRLKRQSFDLLVIIFINQQSFEIRIYINHV